MAFAQVSAAGEVAVVRLDDGKANVFSRRTIAEMHAALDEASPARAVVVAGREGILSAGLDLAEVRSDAQTQRALRNEFMRLMLRVFTLETPVVIACTGHALAGGAALLAAADRMIGADGPYRIGFNEVAAGVAMSVAAVELVRYRLAMPWFESMVRGEVFDPPGAVTAGLLDELASDPVGAALEAAEQLAELDARAFGVTKRAARRPTAELIAAALDRSESRGRPDRDDS